MQTGCLTEVLFDQDCTLLTKSKNWTNGPIFNYRGFQTNEMLLIYSVPDVKSQRKKKPFGKQQGSKIATVFRHCERFTESSPVKIFDVRNNKAFCKFRGPLWVRVCNFYRKAFIRKILIEVRRFQTKSWRSKLCNWRQRKGLRLAERLTSQTIRVFTNEDGVPQRFCNSIWMGTKKISSSYPSRENEAHS